VHSIVAVHGCHSGRDSIHLSTTWEVSGGELEPARALVNSKDCALALGIDVNSCIKTCAVYTGDSFWLVIDETLVALANALLLRIFCSIV